MKFLTPLKIIFAVLTLILLRYMVYPTPPFPGPPPDAVQSDEPADTENPLRRAYFTNYTREQIVAFYKAQYDWLPTLVLNYPPEEGQTIIRDQTRTSYLEEIVHPFRESIFINGFVPREAKDEIWFKGQNFQEKITIRYVPSGIYWRIFLSLLTMLLSYLIVQEYWVETKAAFKLLKKRLGK